MYTIVKNYEKIEISGELTSEEAIQIIEFYKKIGYNTVTSDYETLYMSRKDPDHLHRKQIENLEWIIKTKEYLISELNKEIKILIKKSEDDLENCNEHKKLLKRYEAAFESLTNLSERHKGILTENEILKTNVKDLNHTIERMKKEYFKIISQGNKE